MLRLTLLPALLLASTSLPATIWFDVNAGSELQTRPDMQQPPLWTLDQTLGARVNWEGNPRRDLRLSVQYDLAQRWRVAAEDEMTALSPASETAPQYRIGDLDSQWGTLSDDVRISQNLDRLNVQYFTDTGDLTLGRQAVSLGISPQFSPVDVIMPAGLTQPNRRYRPGVDAVRWRQGTGPVGELDLALVSGQDDRLGLARIIDQVGSVDVEATALSANAEHHLLALGTRASLGQWGVWQESALLIGPEEQGVRLTLGADQQFMNDVFVVAEYHFNGLGDADSQPPDADNNFYQLGMVTPWGRHYAALQASRSLSVLWQAQLGTTLNAQDGGLLVNAGVNRSLGNNSDLDFLAVLPIADDASEFGQYPGQFSLNWSTVF